MWPKVLVPALTRAVLKLLFIVVIRSPDLRQKTQGLSGQCSARNRALDSMASRAAALRATDRPAFPGFGVRGFQIDQVLAEIYPVPFEPQQFS